MKLSDIADNAGSRKKRMRIGRGIGSGKGKTGGRGGKGQTARSGVRIKGFEGGQMPLHRRLPKRGFNNIFRVEFAEINLDRLQDAIDAGSIDAKGTVNAESLVKSGVVRRAKGGIRLLGRGEIKAKLTIEVHGASKSAIAAVEKVGGTVTVLAPPVVKEPPPPKVYKTEEEPKQEKPAKGAKEKAPKQALGGTSTPVEPATGSMITAAMVEASCSATSRSSSSARCAPQLGWPRLNAASWMFSVCGR